MKKILLNSVFVLLTMSAFAQQPKFTTFSDTLNWKDQFNNNIFATNGFFSLLELPNNQGYNLHSFYTGGMNYPFQFIHLDIDGSLLSDTIYEFLPFNPFQSSTFINSSNQLYLNNSTIVLSDMDDTSFSSEPFLFAINQTTKNVAWSTIYLGSDTSASFQKGMFAAGNDVIVYGNNETFSPSFNDFGFIYSINAANGQLNWSKHLGYVFPDTNQFEITTGALANDGNFLFSGSVSQQTLPFNNMLRLFKTDATGTMLWDTLFNLTNFLGNDTIRPDDSKHAIKIVPLSDGSASLIINIDCVPTFLIVVNFDVSTGAINYAKKYDDVGQQVDAEKVFADENDDLIILARGGATFEDKIGVIAANGNPLSLVVLNDSIVPTGGSYEFISTSDGGYLFEFDKLNTSSFPEGYLFMKVNKAILSSCSYPSASAVYGVEDVLIVPENLSTLNPSKNVLIGNVSSTTPTNNFVIENDVVCNCKISLSGTVLDGTAPVSGITVQLFKVRNGMYQLYDTTVTNASGTYIFDYLPEEQFIMKALTNIPNTVATYYGIPNDHANWDSAWVFNLSCTNQNLIQKDISIIPTVPQNGSGQLSGFVFEYTGFGNRVKGGKGLKNLGDPVPGIGISVCQSPSGVVGTVNTGTNGKYNFTGLNNNTTFQIMADVPGLPNDSTYTISITVTNNNFDSLNFFVGGDSIFILDTLLTTGISLYQSPTAEVNLLPNPAQKNVTVEIITQENSKNQATITILNHTGATIKKENITIRKGTNNTIFDVSELANGMYFLQIHLDNAVIVKKLIKN